MVPRKCQLLNTFWLHEQIELAVEDDVNWCFSTEEDVKRMSIAPWSKLVGTEEEWNEVGTKREKHSGKLRRLWIYDECLLGTMIQYIVSHGCYPLFLIFCSSWQLSWTCGFRYVGSENISNNNCIAFCSQKQSKTYFSALKVVMIYNILLSKTFWATRNKYQFK